MDNNQNNYKEQQQELVEMAQNLTTEQLQSAINLLRQLLEKEDF